MLGSLWRGRRRLLKVEVNRRSIPFVRHPPWICQRSRLASPLTDFLLSSSFALFLRTEVFVAWKRLWCFAHRFSWGRDVERRRCFHVGPVLLVVVPFGH